MTSLKLFILLFSNFIVEMRRAAEGTPDVNGQADKNSLSHVAL
jgi:hypothetical protein